MESDSNSKGEYVAVNTQEKEEGQESKNKSSQDNFPEHNWARWGNLDRLRELLSEGNPNVFGKDKHGMTPFHWLASGWGGKEKQSFQCMKTLLEYPQLCYGEMDKAGYIDTQDKKGITALYISAESKCKIITKYLIEAGADITIRSKKGLEPRHFIAENFPEVIVDLCNSSIKLCVGDVMEENFGMHIDFRTIVGTRPSESDLRGGTNSYVKLPVESDFLKKALKSSNKGFRDILFHPLVQIFLNLKWKKIRPLFYASIFFHIIWLILYTMFVVDVYLKSCPYIPPEGNSSGNNSSEVERVRRHSSGGGASNNRCPPDTSEPQRARFTWFGELFPNVNDNQERTCDLNEVNMATTYILLSITLVVAIKEVFEFSKTERKIHDYFMGMENIGQWLLIASVLLTSWPVFSLDKNMPEWQYSTAAFGIFLAWTLILSQIAKLPKFGIYVGMLVKVLKSFPLFIMTFVSLLIAFALSLSILIPGTPAFSSLPLALLKVLMMMVGELNYDEVFHGDEAITPFPIAAHIIFAIFALMVTIILINLMIGITVSDIQGLQSHAEVNTMLTSLEQIHSIESFLLSDVVQICFAYCKRTASLQNLLITKPWKPDGTTVYFPICRIPKKLREDVRRLAAANIKEKVVYDKKEEFRSLLNRLNSITDEIFVKPYPETSTAPM